MTTTDTFSVSEESEKCIRVDGIVDEVRRLLVRASVSEYTMQRSNSGTLGSRRSVLVSDRHKWVATSRPEID